MIVLAALLPLSSGCGRRAVNNGNGDASAHGSDSASPSPLPCDPATVICVGDLAHGVVCRCPSRVNPPPPTPPPPVTPPSPPDPDLAWQCSKTAPEVCRKLGGDRGIPNEESGWKCHQQLVVGALHITCARLGKPALNTPGWSCRQVGSDTTVCNRLLQPSDRPDLGEWACRSSSDTGLVCERIKHADGSCTPGQRRWCEGLAYSTWGIATCTAEGKWPRRVVNGRNVLDCLDMPGQRPDTICSCFHIYFTAACCERTDCIVPAGKLPTPVCPSAGTKLCDPCNPQKPQCGGCVVTNTFESFCTLPCGAGGSCPSGQVCTAVKKQGATTDLCVPDTYACYDGL